MTRRVLVLISVLMMRGGVLLGINAGTGPIVTPALAQVEPTATRPPVPPLATATPESPPPTATPVPPPTDDSDTGSAPSPPTTTPTSTLVALLPASGDATGILPTLWLGLGLLIAGAGAVAMVGLVRKTE